MIKKSLRPLTLHRETLCALSDPELRGAQGARPTGIYCTDACTQTCNPCTRYC